MSQAAIEHVNITVSDATATANLMCQLFDWHIKKVHIGSL